jgi:Predicted permease
MEWLDTLFINHSALQAVVVVSLISALGLALGKIHIMGISLGVTFVFFAGILAGHMGLSIDPQMLNYAESFGLVIFVYSLGLQVGPGFFSSFRKGGMQLNMLSLLLIALGTILAIVCHLTTGVSLPDMVGILCGATTNTPALGAAQQTLQQMGLPSSTPALSCAVTYPLGVLGVIIAVLLIRKLFVRKEDITEKDKDNANKTYIAEFQVFNPGIYGKSIKDIAHLSSVKFVISRLWRDNKVTIPTSEKILQKGDRLLVITSEKDVEAMTVLFGEQEHTDWNKDDIDWNAIDSQLISQRIIVTRPEINGKKLGSLRLRNHYGINISRVYRAGVQLLATSELVLQMGDRLTVVGEAAAIQNVEKVLGNAVKSLKEPNLVAVFIGIILGLALGAIPFTIPGISAPVKLGLAGGPIIVGILIGTFGPRLHMVTYTTLSANLMLRGLGLSMYLACLGLDAGAHFFETVVRPEGVLWIGLGFAITFIPVVVTGLIALKVMKVDFRFCIWECYAEVWQTPWH